MSDAPSAGLLAGQLGYLFEEHPDLRDATTAALTERLNHDDRYARALAKYPEENDEGIRHHIGEFDERISVADVEAALTKYRADQPTSDG